MKRKRSERPKGKRQRHTPLKTEATIVSTEADRIAQKSPFYYLFLFSLLAFSSFTYAYWLTDIFDSPKPTVAAETAAKSKTDKKAIRELPPDWDLPPDNSPIDRGYNASSGQFPPGALPPGVSLPGMTGFNPAMAARTMEQGYGAADGVRQKFTGQIRDGETGLDYFNARYYSSRLGRFYSVDPENAGAKLEDPQSWNAYAYARNNPLKYTDPDGLEYLICSVGEGKRQCYRHNDSDVLNSMKAGFLDYVGTKSNETGLRSGSIYDENGDRIATYQQISHDDPIQAMLWGANHTLNTWKDLIELVQPAPVPGGGPVIKGASKAAKVGKVGGQAAKVGSKGWKTTKASRPLNMMGHAQKHLDDFRNIDPSLSADDVANILEHVKNIGKKTPSANNSTRYEAVVDIAGKPVTVRVVQSSSGVIKTGYPIN